MATIQNQTQNLLLKLKLKKFNSQSDSNLINTNINELKNGFLCSYHPTEIITNFCVSQGEDKPKPLCPKCLQQHIKSHQDQSSICKLQTSESELTRISVQLNEKYTNCSAISQKIETIDEWKMQSIEEMKSELRSYKKQVIEAIQNLFKTIETELVRKYQQQNKTYQQIVKVMQMSIPDLKQICSRSLSFLNQKKDLNSIILGLPQITEKYQSLVNNEKRMIQNCSTNHEMRFIKKQLTEVINVIRTSIEYKFNKINEIELDKKLKKLKVQKQQQIKQLTEQKIVNKTQKMSENKSPNKLFTIERIKDQNSHSNIKSPQKQFLSTVPSSPRVFSKTYQSQSVNDQNSTQDMLTKLNETTNRLKDSLEGFYRAKKKNVY